MKSYLLAGLAAVLLSACSLPSPEKVDEDKKLFEYGNQLFERKRYSDAAPYYEEIKNRFPESPYVIESELKLADAHFFTKEYPSAQIEYESFRTLHPTHEKIPYVHLQIAKSQLYQAPKSVQKDQNQTEQALLTLGQLTTQWPRSDAAAEGHDLIVKANEKLAKKKLYQADFYMSQKKYFPALRRLESLNNSDISPEIRREALFKLGKVHTKMKNYDIARSAFQRVVDEEIDDQFTKRAKLYLTQRLPKDQ